MIICLRLLLLGKQTNKNTLTRWERGKSCGEQVQKESQNATKNPSGLLHMLNQVSPSSAACLASQCSVLLLLQPQPCNKSVPLSSDEKGMQDISSATGVYRWKQNLTDFLLTFVDAYSWHITPPRVTSAVISLFNSPLAKTCQHKDQQWEPGERQTKNISSTLPCRRKRTISFSYIYKTFLLSPVVGDITQHKSEVLHNFSLSIRTVNIIYLW